MGRVDAFATIARLARRVRRPVARNGQRGRPITAGLALLLAVLVGGGLGIAGYPTGSNALLAVAANLHSLDQLFARRSPGTRTAGELVKTKSARKHPISRTASTTRQPGHARVSPGIDIPLVAELIGKPELVPTEVQLDVQAPVGEFPIVAPSTGTIAGPGAETGSSPGGLTPGTTPGTEPRTPVESAPAVPEPQSWAMMLVGFAALGWCVRRAPRTGESVGIAGDNLSRR